MNGYNRVTLAGNLTRDPELRFLPSGTGIAEFGIAMNRRWHDGNGDECSETTFVDVTAFGKTAETIAQYVKKGRPLLIEGRLKLDQWEDKKTKEKRSKLSVVLESFVFLDSGKEEK
jgi:single-strand DNA-binding protein